MIFKSFSGLCCLKRFTILGRMSSMTLFELPLVSCHQALHDSQLPKCPDNVLIHVGQPLLLKVRYARHHLA